MSELQEVLLEAVKKRARAKRMSSAEAKEFDKYLKTEHGITSKNEKRVSQLINKGKIRHGREYTKWRDKHGYYDD